jgi:5'(3')-deoxyribonucleotidase
MRKIKIALDMDEVIVDLIGHWEMIYRLKANIPITEEIEVKDWDVAKSFNKLPKEDVYGMLDMPGMFRHCSPISGAIHGINTLLCNDAFDVHILTVAKAKTAYSEKIEWVQEHLGTYMKNRVIGLPSYIFKAELANNYDVMVEDNNETLGCVSASSGCHRILFKQPHNYMATCPIDFDDAVDGWEQLIERLFEYARKAKSN